MKNTIQFMGQKMLSTINCCELNLALVSDGKRGGGYLEDWNNLNLDTKHLHLQDFPIRTG